MRLLKLLAALVLLPLLIAGYGAWQGERVGAPRPNVEQQKKDIDFQIAKMRLDQLQNRWGGSFHAPDGNTYGGPLAIQKLQEYRDSLDLNNTVATVRSALPWWTVAMALSTVAIGLASLLLIGFFGQIARLSRWLLFVTFSMAHRILPFILAIQMLLLAGAISTALGYELMGYWEVGRRSSGDMKLIGVLFTACIAMPFIAFAAVKQLKMTRAAFKPSPLDVFGREVSESEAPKLWSFVRELAGRIGALVPDHIVVGLTQGFFVTSSAVALYPEERGLTGRTLYLPLPYMVLLDLKEITAIVGHELAHFSGADTEYSQRFLPIYAATQRNLNAVYRTTGREGATKNIWLENIIVGPAYMLGLSFLQQFHNAVQYWSRKREFAADAAGAKIVGSQAAASALVRTSIILPRINEVLSKAHEHPETAPEDLLAEVVRVAREKGLDDAKVHLEDELPHPTDSHPPTRARVLAVGEKIDEVLLAHATRPVALGSERVVDFLFANAAALNQQLTSDLTGAVKKRNAHIETALTQQAESVAGEVEVYDDTRWQLWICRIGLWGTLIGAAGFIASTMLWSAKPYNDLGGQIAIALIVATPLIISFAVLVSVFKRRANVLTMRLTTTGITFSNTPREIPWTHFSDINMQTISGHGVSRTTITFDVMEGMPLPEVNKRRLRSVDVAINKRKRRLSLGLLNAKSEGKRLAHETLRTMLGTYWNAACARQALEKRRESRALGSA